MTTTEQDQQEIGFDGNFDSVDFTSANELIETLVSVKPRLEQQFDLTTVDPDERVQVRIDKNNAPKEMVQRFAAQMSFSLFPPIVVTEDARVVDGNTRVKARRAREERYCSALVIPVSWDDADELTRTKIEYLGLALNNSNGKPLDRAEKRKMVRDALQLGMTPKQITATVGFPTSVINAIRLELAGEKKLERVGLKAPDEETKMRPAALRSLGRQVDLNDQPFTELATLTDEAGFAVGEISALAAAVRETGSDELGLERIAREREANAQRIADRAQGKDGYPPAARQLKSRLGFINDKEVSALVETNPERMADHIEALESAIAKLQEVLVEQQKLVT
jgi:hypothetical protein